MTVANIQNVNPLDVRPAAGRSVPERLERMNVRCGDAPDDRAPAAVGGAAYRGLDLVREVGERLENGFGERSHGRPPAGGRLRHGRIVPLDVVRQEPDEIIELPGIPRVHEPLDHIH